MNVPSWLVFLILFFSMTACALGEGAFPPTGENGFLPEGEFVYENPEDGIWRYLSPTLRIEILRHYDESKWLTYTVADVRTRKGSGERFRMIPKNPEDRMARYDYVHDIAKENGVIFATSSDYAHLRLRQKTRAGLLIRDGEVIFTKTRMKGSTRFPNLDTLALFDDGDMQVHRVNEITAEDYLALGATDVLAFGPILVRDGELSSPAIFRAFGNGRAPRIGIGMVEKGHYISIMAEGRHPDSRGVNTETLANMFLERGCILALNLDGGQTASMAFMGKQIIRVGKTENLDAPARSTAEILGIGYTKLPMEADSE